MAIIPAVIPVTCQHNRRTKIQTDPLMAVTVAPVLRDGDVLNIHADPLLGVPLPKGVGMLALLICQTGQPVIRRHWGKGERGAMPDADGTMVMYRRQYRCCYGPSGQVRLDK